MVFCIEETSKKFTFPLTMMNRSFDDARKAYLNALKYDPNNQNVLRDLGQL